eukprot:m.8027 g.8027  ORF g.8027 m.8027 type:complete len:946 (+) comp3822_c0_seq1:241-3078(+)
MADKPLVAQPSEVDQNDDPVTSVEKDDYEDDTFDITNLLQEMVSSSKVDPSLGDQIKLEYATLRGKLFQLQRREQSLLGKAKELTENLKENEEQAELAIQKDEQNQEDVGLYRSQMEECARELQEMKSQEELLENKLAYAKAEHEELQTELNGLKEKEAEVDPEVEEIKATNAQIRIDISKSTEDITSLQAELEERKQERKTQQDELASTQAEIEELKVKLQVESALPERIAKQAEHQFGHSIKSYTAQLNEATQLRDKLAKDIEENENKKSETDNEMKELNFKIEKETHARDMTRRRKEHIELEVKGKMEESKTYLADMVHTQGVFKNVKRQLKNAEDLIVRKGKERDAGLRSLKSIEAKLQHSRALVGGVEARQHELESEIKTKKLQSKDLEDSIEKAQHDVDILQRTYEGRRIMSDAEKLKMKDLKIRLNQAEKDCAEFKTKSNNLAREVRSKQHAVNQATTDSLRGAANAARAENEVLSKELIKDDCKKSVDALTRSLKEVESVYQVVKNERNKFVQQIANAYQRQTEMKEKVRILDNETEILRSSALEREAKLALGAQKFGAEERAKEKILQDEAAQKFQLEGMKHDKRMIKLTLTEQEDSMSDMQNKSKQMERKVQRAVQEKNELGRRLLDRHDELIMCYEKLNIFSRLSRTGDVKIQDREDEIRFLRLEVGELQRSIKLAREKQPVKKSLEDEIINTRIELLAAQERVQRLESDVESPNKKKWRALPGSDGTQEELNAQRDKLMRLIELKEQKLLERDLVFREAERLASRAREKLSSGQGSALDMARKLTMHKSKLRDTTKKLMAALAELSMHHATCIHQEQEISTLNTTLDEARNRLEQGLPPTKQAEKEWNRMETKAKTASKNNEVSYDDGNTELFRTLKDGTKTHAEHRPNAYMPTSELDLPIARPYGREAPFKAAEPSPAMLRHFRAQAQQHQT